MVLKRAKTEKQSNQTEKQLSEEMVHCFSRVTHAMKTISITWSHCLNQG